MKTHSPNVSLAKEIIADLRSRDIRVWLEQDQVAIDPEKLLTDEDREQVRTWKGDIFYELDRERIALRNPCALSLEYQLAASVAVMKARVSESSKGWSLYVDFWDDEDHVYEGSMYLPSAFSEAIERVSERVPGRVRVSEITWFHNNWGESPYYVVHAEGLVLADVVAEMKRILDERTAEMAKSDEEPTRRHCIHTSDCVFASENRIESR